MDQNDQAGNRVIVVGICGSIRRGSYTRLAVQVALQAAQEVGAQTRLIDLKDYQLVFCDGKTDESAFPADVLKLRGEVRQAGGIILGTPEYQGSFSGVLKNALDLMGSDEKPMAAIPLGAALQRTADAQPLGGSAQVE